MHKYKPIDEKDKNQITANVGNMIKSALQSGDVSEITKAIEVNRVTASENGAVIPNVKPDVEQEFTNTVKETLSEETPSGIVSIEDHRRQREQRDKNLQGTYYKNKSSQKVVTPDETVYMLGDIIEDNPESNLSDVEESKHFLDKIQYGVEPTQEMIDEISKNLVKVANSFAPTPTESYNKARREAAMSKKTEWASDDIAYRQESFTIGGQTKPYKLAIHKVNWGDEMIEGRENSVINVAKLQSLVTQSIYDTYGSWDRITNIYVVDEMLIINGVCYFPAIEEKYLNSFPMDAYDYIRNGRLAQFFDWWFIRKMKNLVEIGFDDANYFVRDVADKLGVSREIGERTLFKACKSLQTIIVENTRITRETQHTPEGNAFKEKIAQKNRFLNIMDGYKINVCAGTQGLQDYTFNNLKEYANNRGDKGIFRFCCGTIARAGLAGVSGAINLGTHLARGFFRVAKEVITSSVTPVTQDDIQS